jgi:hypothetical protein
MIKIKLRLKRKKIETKLKFLASFEQYKQKKIVFFLLIAILFF